MSAASQAQAGGYRAPESRKAARDHRLRLRLRLDLGERLLDLGERLTVADVVKPTGLDQPTVRRLRHARAALQEAAPSPETATAVS